MSRHPEDEELDCERFDDLLESFIDDDLDPLNQRRVEQHLAACGSCTRQWRLALRVQGGLRSLPSLECPDRVVDAALAQIAEASSGRDSESSQATSTGARIVPLKPRSVSRRRIWQPLLAVAAMLLLVVSLPRLFDAPGIPESTSTVDSRTVDSRTAPRTIDSQALPSELEGLSPEEIARAEAEVKLALAYLGQITEASGQAVGHDVLGKKVILPLSRSVRKALTINETEGIGNAS